MNGELIRTTVVLTVAHTRPAAGLAESIASLAMGIDGVISASNAAPLPAGAPLDLDSDRPLTPAPACGIDGDCESCQ